MKTLAAFFLLLLLVSSCLSLARTPLAPQCYTIGNKFANRIDYSGQIWVTFDEKFSEKEKETMTRGFKKLKSAFGLEFLEGENHSEITWNKIFVRKWISSRDSNVIGQYIHGQSQVLIDSTRVSTRTELDILFLHEVGHWLGLTHICLPSDKSEPSSSSSCSPVGTGVAIMNPTINYSSSSDFSELDIKEYLRVRDILLNYRCDSSL